MIMQSIRANIPIAWRFPVTFHFTIFIYVCNVLFLPSKYTDDVLALLLFICSKTYGAELCMIATEFSLHINIIKANMTEHFLFF